MNPGRSTVTFTCLTCSGMPCRIVGNGSVSTVICALCGSTLTLALTTTQSHGPEPMSYGPAFAGTAIDKPNGAPRYGPVMNTWPVGTVNGSVPKPALTVVCPIRLSGPHVPRLACGSGHCFTDAKSPINPGGRCNCTPLRTC